MNSYLDGNLVRLRFKVKNMISDVAETPTSFEALVTVGSSAAATFTWDGVTTVPAKNVVALTAVGELELWWDNTGTGSPKPGTTITVDAVGSGNVTVAGESQFAVISRKA